MREIISKTFKIKVDKLPPNVDFIEQKIKEQKLEPLRWAIVEVNENVLTISASGSKID